ncbi:hypothetical protein E0H80_07890 [Acinetobacter sp. ANC 4779]|uniref:hypothetical protein n=1 Tax=Acinetobacter sp. ANC 4779 TaxID=2529848 RepID=UPI001038A2F5|nr:hypothetical protein [Acinetobacter sp. ANC 4779]TCB50739.1 hypothetical protein E0H80_07890 [Acinetobacter sp. ANC 4779]
MYKKLILTIIFTLSPLSIFAQTESNLNFTGEIYENTCDLMSPFDDEKCEILSKNSSINDMVINKEMQFSQNIQTYINNFREIHTTFYAVNLKSIKSVQATNLEIIYK